MSPKACNLKRNSGNLVSIVILKKMFIMIKGKYAKTSSVLYTSKMSFAKSRSSFSAFDTNLFFVFQLLPIGIVILRYCVSKIPSISVQFVFFAILLVKLFYAIVAQKDKNFKKSKKELAKALF